MSWLVGSWEHLGAVAGKAALMYVIALIALRLGERRTLAQWSTMDFATAVAMGAIVGRTSVAGRQSFITGCVALITLVALHRAVSFVRLRGAVVRLIDHPVVILVRDGRMDRSRLRRCGLTEDDLFAGLREQGYFSLDGLRYVLFESKGSLTVVPEDQVEHGDPQLVRAAIRGDSSAKRSI